MVLLCASLGDLLAEAEGDEVIKQDRLVPIEQPGQFVFPSGLIAGVLDLPAPPGGVDRECPFIYPVPSYPREIERFLLLRNPDFEAYVRTEEGRRQYVNFLSQREPINPLFFALIGGLLENAFGHGNMNDPTLPVEVTVYEGSKAHVISIKDQGRKRFDYRTRVAQLRSGIQHFEHEGWGLRAAENFPWKVAYNSSENSAYVLFPGAMQWTLPA